MAYVAHSSYFPWKAKKKSFETLSCLPLFDFKNLFQNNNWKIYINVCLCLCMLMYVCAYLGKCVFVFLLLWLCVNSYAFKKTKNLKRNVSGMMLGMRKHRGWQKYMIIYLSARKPHLEMEFQKTGNFCFCTRNIISNQHFTYQSNEVQNYLNKTLWY